MGDYHVYHNNMKKTQRHVFLTDRIKRPTISVQLHGKWCHVSNVADLQSFGRMHTAQNTEESFVIGTWATNGSYTTVITYSCIRHYIITSQMYSFVRIPKHQMEKSTAATENTGDPKPCSYYVTRNIIGRQNLNQYHCQWNSVESSSELQYNGCVTWYEKAIRIALIHFVIMMMLS